MKRKPLRIAAICLAVLLAAYVGADLFLGSLVTAGVNRFGPLIAHTKVELSGARLSPLTGSGTLTGLTVDNPTGWSQGPAFTLGRIHVKVVPTSLLGDHVIIEDLTIEKPVFTYETRILSSNIGDLLRNFEGTGSGPSAGSSGGKPLRFEVRHFSVSGGIVRIGVGDAALPLPMPPVTLDNLGTAEGGITAGQLATAIMRSLSGSVVSATTQAAKKVTGTLGAAAGAGIKSLFGGKSQ
jgi:hypothetical protein